MRYIVYESHKEISDEQFELGNYNFVEMSNTIKIGETDNEEEALDLFARFNDPAIIETNNGYELIGYWLEGVEEENHWFICDSDFEELEVKENENL